MALHCCLLYSTVIYHTSWQCTELVHYTALHCNALQCSVVCTKPHCLVPQRNLRLGRQTEAISQQCAQCTIHYILHTVHYTLHYTHCTLQTTYSTLYIEHWTLHTTHCTLNTERYTRHTVHCTISRPVYTILLGKPHIRGVSHVPCTLSPLGILVLWVWHRLKPPGHIGASFWIVWHTPGKVFHWCLRHFWSVANYSVNRLLTKTRYVYWW